MNRNEKILEYWKKGKKQTDIARMYGLSRERIGQIVRKSVDNIVDKLLEQLEAKNADGTPDYDTQWKAYQKMQQRKL